MALCRTCDYGAARVRGECMTCYMWRKNHGGETRPDEAICAHGTYVFENGPIRKPRKRKVA